MNQLNRQTLDALANFFSEGHLRELKRQISEIQITGTECPEDLLDYLGIQVDVASLDQGCDLAEDAIKRLQKFAEVTSTPKLKGTAYYFLANAHDAIWQIERRSVGYIPSWSDLRLPNQKVALSEALRFREELQRFGCFKYTQTWGIPLIGWGGASRPPTFMTRR